MAATLTFDILARDKASKTISKVGTSAEKTSKKFDVLKGVAVGAGIAAGAALFKFGKDSVAAFTEAEAAQTKLSDAFARFPKLADSNITAFRDLNTELAKKTKFDDDAYASGQAVLAQFGLTGKQILNITPLLGDYAAKTGKDLPTASKLLGKAFLGNTKALKDLGIVYKPTGDKAKDMANITKLLRTQVGGFAAKEGKTAAGKTEILKNQFGELQETVGSKLVPVLQTLTEWGLKVVDFISRNSDVIVPLVGVIGTIIAAIKIWTGVQAALNIVMALNPVALIVIAIAGLVAGVIIAYKKFKGFRDVVAAVFDWIKKNWPLLLGIITGPFGLIAIAIVKNFDTIKEKARTVFLFIANIFLDMIEGMLGALGKLLGAFAHLPGPLGKPFRKARDAVNDAKKSVEDFQKKINATHGKTVKITAEMKMKNRLKISAAQGGTSLLLSGKPMYLAAGGGVRGPGGRDKVPAMLTRDEYVIKAPSARKLGPAFLDRLNRVGDIGGDVAGMVVSTGKRLKLAAGGMVAAQNFVRAQASDPYVWGGVGPNGFDCSGLVGAAAAVAKGIANPFQRFFTTASNLAAAGWQRGLGAFSMGVRPGIHMAGNVGGLGFEAASTNLGIRVGGRATPMSGFPEQWHLPQFGNVFGGMGSVALGPRELQQLMKAVNIQWGVPSAGRVQSFANGTPYVPHTGMYQLHRGEAVTPAGGPRVVIELRSSGSKLDDLLMEALRRSIRVKGGNVQAVIGT
jgi:hypothetical protein